MRTLVYLASVAPLSDEALAARLLQTVPQARREKVTRCRDAGAKRLLLGAGLLLNRALGDAGLRAGEYAVTPEGKPWFPDLPDFRFSLSHSGETVICAVGDEELGCDVERVRDFDLQLAKRFFHPEEGAWIFSLPEEERRDAFFRLWTLKESYMKAVGLGFSLPMSEFAFSFADGIRLAHAADARPWRFLSFREGDCFCALCAPDAGPETPILRTPIAE